MKSEELQMDLKNYEEWEGLMLAQGCQFLYLPLKISTQVLFSELRIAKIFLAIRVCLTNIRFMIPNPPSIF